MLRFGRMKLKNQKVKNIIEADESRKIVVVSALGKRNKEDHKITDLLYLTAAHLKYNIDAYSIFNIVKERYFEVKKELDVDVDLEEEFKIIRPAGGGGTDFQIIFEYVHKHMSDKPPASIIILTDGFAPFPQEKLTGGIPVLWLLNNDTVDPPWGKVARIKV